MLLERIKQHEILSNFLVEECEEEGVCVKVDDKIEEGDYLILKPDAYYNSLNIAKRPKSPDCLFIVKCQGGGYGLTIAELKKTSTAGHFKVADIVGKFETCLYQFMQEEFGDLLNVEYKRIDLYFVSNVEIYKRDMGLKMKVLSGKRFKFNDLTCLIKPFMPSPAVKMCY